MNWPTAYCLIGAAGIVGALITTPFCRMLARHLDVMDHPSGEAHKGHADATPLLGGMAMLSAWLMVIATGIAVTLLAGNSLPESLRIAIPGIRSVFGLLAVLIAGATAIAIVGLVDDYHGMGARTKLLSQIVVCGFTALYPKIRITLFWDVEWLTWGLTVFWLVFIVNAFNFFDNMDGLAAGTAIIASLLFTLVAGLQGQYFVATLGAVTSGAAIGFWFYNRSPASIFMGDSGSHFLGYLLGVLGTLTVFYNESSPTTAPVLIPIFILALPIFDTFAVVLIRLKAGKPVYVGDHNHISHRFYQMGLSRKAAVQMVHLLAIAIGLGALPLLWLDLRGVALVLLQSAAMLTLVTLLHMHLREKP